MKQPTKNQNTNIPVDIVKIETPQNVLKKSLVYLQKNVEKIPS